MSATSPILLIHIAGATIGLLSGALAMIFRKGSGLHAAAGTAFFISMMAMSSSAAYVAAFERINGGNFIVAILTFYLVTTAWAAARRRDGKIGLFDWAALLVISADAIRALTWGLQAVSSPTGTKDGMPAAVYFVFGTIALLCASADVRMIIRGGHTGARRIGRHLRRMCLALTITLFSLYPGQAKLFSAAIRESNLMMLPHLLLLGATLFWIVRVRRWGGAKSVNKEVHADPAWQAPQLVHRG